MDAVGFAERVPCQVDRKLMEPDKESTSSDEIERCMEFKKKQFAGLERLECSIRRRAPEIHLIHAIPGFEEREPIIICDGNEEAHFCESAVYSRVASSGERKLHHQTTGFGGNR